ncbi:hypothetical protein SANA_03940 [Gottschalkiaceae bacterium SANA]|nr:hypothetical protein SANA_03940 [Gottschalkiaceae bacterium SANA]
MEMGDLNEGNGYAGPYRACGRLGCIFSIHAGIDPTFGTHCNDLDAGIYSITCDDDRVCCKKESN